MGTSGQLGATIAFVIALGAVSYENEVAAVPSESAVQSGGGSAMSSFPSDRLEETIHDRATLHSHPPKSFHQREDDFKTSPNESGNGRTAEHGGLCMASNSLSKRDNDQHRTTT